MKVLVPIKRVVDPYVKIRVRSDNTGLELANVKMCINPFDEIAIEEAVRLKEAGLITEIMVVSIGDETVKESLRAALAQGADVAQHVLYKQPLEPLNVAKCLKAIVEKENPKLIIMGKQAIDDDCNQTGQMLAALLGWPQATFASKVVLDKANETVEVTREIDGGLETLALRLPCVITTDLRLNEPRYTSLPNIMQAKRKPLTEMDISTLGVTLKPHVKVLKVTPPLPRKAGKMLNNVTELVHYLKEVEKVI